MWQNKGHRRQLQHSHHCPWLHLLCVVLSTNLPRDSTSTTHVLCGQPGVRRVGRVGSVKVLMLRHVGTSHVAAPDLNARGWRHVASSEACSWGWSLSRRTRWGHRTWPFAEPGLEQVPGDSLWDLAGYWGYPCPVIPTHTPHVPKMMEHVESPWDSGNEAHQNNLLDFYQQFYITYETDYRRRPHMCQISPQTPSTLPFRLSGNL
jgi:hypothetical protein